MKTNDTCNFTYNRVLPHIMDYRYFFKRGDLYYYFYKKVYHIFVQYMYRGHIKWN